MNRSKFYYLFLIGLSALIILTGCSFNEINTPDTGSVQLSISNEVRSKGFNPSISMQIDSYKVSGKGPGTSAFGPIAITHGSVVIDNLAPGTWEVEVTGYNEENNTIGKGIIFVTVIAGYTQKKTIFVEEIGGMGSFEITLDLPETVKPINRVDLSFYRDEEPERITSFSLPNETALKIEGLASGFWAVSILLYDEDNTQIWGKADSLRIVKDQTTSANITINKEDIESYGGLDLTIIDNMPVLFDVSITPNIEVIGVDETIIFTAQPSLSDGTFTYWWFLDGKRVEGENSKTFALDVDLSFGSHNISVVATRAGVFAASNKSIVKIDDLTTLGVRIRLTNKNNPSDVRTITLSSGPIGDFSSVGAPLFSGHGTPIGARVYNPNDGAFEYTAIMALNEPIDVDEMETHEGLVMFAVSLDLDQAGKLEHRLGYIAFDYSLLFPDLDFISIIDSSSSDLIVSVSSFGEVGEPISGIMACSDLALYGRDQDNNNLLIGNYSLDIQFAVERYPDIMVGEYDELDPQEWADGLYPAEINAIVSEIGQLPNESGVLFLAPDVINSPNASNPSTQNDYSYDVTVRGRGDTFNELHLNEGEFAKFLPLPQGDYWLDIQQYQNNSMISGSGTMFEITNNSPTIIWLDYLQGYTNSDGYLRNVNTVGITANIRSKLPIYSSTGDELSPSDFAVENGYVHSIDVDHSWGEYNYTLMVRTNDISNRSLQVRVRPNTYFLLDGKRRIQSQLFTSSSMQPLYFDELFNATYEDREGNILTDGMYFSVYKSFIVRPSSGYAFAGWKIPDNILYRQQMVVQWPTEQEFALGNVAPKPVIVPAATPHIESIYFERPHYDERPNPNSSLPQPLNNETLIIKFSEPMKNTLGDGTINTDNFVIEGATLTNVIVDGNRISLSLNSFQKGIFTITVKDIASATGNIPLGGQTQLVQRITQISVTNDQPSQGMIDDSCEGLYLTGEFISVTVNPSPNYKVSLVEMQYLPYSGGNTRSGRSDYGEPYSFIATVSSHVGSDIIIRAQYVKRPD